MKALVTGAAGLLGSHVVDVLVERGERPNVLVQPDQRVETQGDVAVFRGDVRDATTLATAMQGVEVVLHCAARTGPWGDPVEYAGTNVDALATLTRVAHAAGVSRVVHVSSITVHGNDVRGAADEDAPLRGAPNPYSRTKVAGELLLRRLVAAGAPVTIVRPGLIYGPRDEGSFGRFAAMIRDGRMIVVGRGNNHLPLVYVRDVVEGMLLAARAPDAIGRAYLLVNDEPVTQLDYLGTIAAELGAAVPSRHVPYAGARLLGTACELAGRVSRRAQPPLVTRFGVEVLGGENRFRIDRARRELGFAPRVAMADGVRRAAEWFDRRAAEPAPTGRT